MPTTLSYTALRAELSTAACDAREHTASDGHTYHRCDRCGMWRAIVGKWDDESGTHRECLYCIDRPRKEPR